MWKVSLYESFINFNELLVELEYFYLSKQHNYEAFYNKQFLLKKNETNNKTNVMIEYFKEYKLSNSCPNLTKLFFIYLSFPFTSVEAERSFSKLY